MFVMKCKDLLEIDALKGAELIAGARGLGNVISWYYVVHAEKIKQGVNGGEVLFITADQHATKVETLKNILEQCYEYGISAVVLEGALAGGCIPQSVINFCDVCSIPLLWSKENLHLVSVTKAISDLIVQENLKNIKVGGFLKEVLSQETNTDKDILGCAETYNVQMKSYFTCAILSFERINAQGESDDIKGFNITGIEKESLKKTLANWFVENNINETSRASENSICYFLTEDSLEQIEKTINKIEKLQLKLQSLYPEYKVMLSFGRVYYKILQIKQSYKEAKMAMKLLKSGAYKKRSIRYENAGIFRLIFEIENKEVLLRYRDDILGKLIDHDQANHGELYNTLKAYLSNNGNLSATAEMLIIHRNTMMYRMDKIKSILDFDFDDPLVRLNVMNAYMISEWIPFI